MHRVLGTIFGVLLSISSATHAGEVVILETNHPMFSVGDMLDESHSVDLPEGTSTTLIMPNGETRVVVGPYKGAVGEAKSSSSTLGVLTASRGSETRVLGVVRAPTWETED